MLNIVDLVLGPHLLEREARICGGSSKERTQQHMVDVDSNSAHMLSGLVFVWSEVQSKTQDNSITK